MNFEFNEIIPLACRWAELKEKEILERGVSLSDDLFVAAKNLGVNCPENVRVLVVNKIPMPDDLILREACNQTSLISNKTIGLTLRYGIYVRQDCAVDTNLYLHELVHVSQYERLGGIEKFLQQYLQEVLTVGYSESSMEQEAINKVRDYKDE